PGRRRRVRGRAGRAAHGRRAVAGTSGDPLDGRGAAGGAVRPPDAHPLPGVGEADPEGPGRPAAVVTAAPASRPLLTPPPSSHRRNRARTQVLTWVRTRFAV